MISLTIQDALALSTAKMLRHGVPEQELAIDIAKSVGVAVVGVRNSAGEGFVQVDPDLAVS